MYHSHQQVLPMAIFFFPLSSALVHINNATVSDNSTVAFGGVKNSGVGREGGSYSIDEFTELKWITVQYTAAQLPF